MVLGIAKGIATLGSRLKGVQSWAKPIKKFSEYKPHFAKVRKNIDDIVATRETNRDPSYLNQTRPKNLNRDVGIAETITKTLSETPAHTLKRSEAIKEYHPRGIMDLVDKQLPDGSFYFPKDVAQELKNYSLAKRQKLWHQEDLIADVNKKFQEPWDPKKGDAFKGYAESHGLHPDSIRSMLPKIEPALKENVLENLTKERRFRRFAQDKIEYNLDELRTVLKDKLITGKNLTRDQELYNLEEFKKAFHGNLGYSARQRGEASEYMGTYLERYAEKFNMPELVPATKVKSKFTADIPILDIKKTPIADRFASRVGSQHVRDATGESLREIVRNLDPVVQQEFNKAKSLKRFFPESRRGVVEIDHILPIMFGGSKKNIDNLTVVLQGSHRGPSYAKSQFERLTHRMMTPSIGNWGQRNKDNIIDAVNNNDMKLARELVKKIQANIKSAKEENLFRFKLGEPHSGYKMGEKNYEMLNDIDLLAETPEKAAIIRNLIKEAIKGGEFVPSHLKVGPQSGQERLLYEAKAAYESLAPYIMEGIKRKDAKLLARKEGGLINSDLTDTIPPTRGPMSDGLPLLDPQESIDRQHFQVGGFASLFGKLSKVPRAVGRFGDIKKTLKIKPPTATEVAVGQAVEDKPAMFLSTINAIEDMPEVTMPANQWLGTIKNKPGVSATELDEFGLEALLTNIAKADPKRKLSKTELIETYNKEMPKIDMDIAIAEPVSRGANDITNMLLRIREKGRGSQQLENLDVFSNDPRLLTALHQPPQDATGMKIRESIINIMRGTNKTTGVGEDAAITPLLSSEYGGQNFKLHKGQHFEELWESAFPKIFHSTNEIVKRDHLNALRHLVSPDDVVNLAKSRNIPEEEAFSQLYQALNIFDRQVMTADVPIPFWTKKMLYRLGDMGEGRGFFYKSKKNPAHEGAQFIPGGSGYGEIKFYQNFETGAIRAQEGTYKSGHFSGEVFKGNTGNSPFGWGRFSERIDESGRKILLMEEIQSDLHQGVAQKGYKYAPRLDKHDVLAEMGEFAKQLDIKKQTLESTRLRKDAIKQLPKVERESAANVAELKNIEKAIKKQIDDVKKLQKKVEEQARLTGRTGQVYPDTAFKKSENYAKLFMQGLMKMAHDKGYDGIALSTGKMKKAHGNIPKGGDKFYDEIGVKAMQRMAKKSGFKFSDTTIVDGNGYTWEKIPLIEMRDINTGMRIPGDPTIPVYKKGGIVNRNVVRGYNGY